MRAAARSNSVREVLTNEDVDTSDATIAHRRLAIGQ